MSEHSLLPARDEVCLSQEDTHPTELEEFLLEVNALAIRLRQETRRGQLAADLPSGGEKVLHLLSTYPALTVPQIARLSFTSRQNIQTIVNRLMREGCVEQLRNPAHKRSELVRLTDRGRASAEAVSRSAEGYKQKLPHFSSKELSQSTKLLRSIREALGAIASVEHGKVTTEVPTESLANPKIRPVANDSSKTPAHQPEHVRYQKSPMETEELPVNLL